MIPPLVDDIEKVLDMRIENIKWRKVKVAKLDYNNLPKGKVTIDGEYVYVNFIEASGKTKNDAVLETHNKMIDIQIVFIYCSVSDVKKERFTIAEGVEVRRGHSRSILAMCWG